MPELQAGQVTIADLFREIAAMRTEVARTLTRLEVLDAQGTAADQLHRDHETRIRKLEAFRWQLMGVYVLLSVLSGYVGFLLGHVK